MSARRPLLPTLVLLLGALYCLFPVAWVLVAATKSSGELFSTTTFELGSSLPTNLGDLSAHRDGLFWRWMANSALYAGVGALLSAAVSGVAGFALAKYSFRGRDLFFNALIAGVLVPSVVLAVPQYLLLAEIGLTDSYLSVLLPSVISPYGIYLARIHASASVPDDVVEAARTDGAGETRVLTSIALPMMLPGLVTVFLFQFVSIWNNFLLPFIMLGDDGKFPVTLGLYTLLNQGNTTPALYTLVVAGSLVSVLPLIGLFLLLQRYWRVDLLSGSVKA
ncbi:carbohydrate ABC transporter permease [Saccharothrix xinjiangensis]|uniref:Carbohydrate ABC transporter permease n=1 Tax=Saccharothrix xinjiangensis TaxID=204798 RepID=A0ABV9Y0U7_9PSEU